MEDDATPGGEFQGLQFAEVHVFHRWDVFVYASVDNPAVCIQVSRQRICLKKRAIRVYEVRSFKGTPTAFAKAKRVESRGSYSSWERRRDTA